LDDPRIDKLQEGSLGFRSRRPDLIQKERSSMGSLDLAGTVLVGAGKGPASISDEFD
jgi:hypothetical protein